MKKALTSLAFVALFAMIALPTNSQAQGLKVGPHLGLNMDGSDLFLGLATQFNLPVGEREMWGNIGLDFYPFIKNETTTRVNLDVLFPFGVGNLHFYGGGGLLTQFSSFDLPEGSTLDDTDTDIGLNIKGGLLLGGSGDGYRPYLEFDQTIGAGSDLSVRLGMFLAIGGR
jgi:hypothetical protein